LRLPLRLHHESLIVKNLLLFAVANGRQTD
jgi:hypothetical protein